MIEPYDLMPNGIARITQFMWACRSQNVEPSVDAFSRVFELYRQPKKAKFIDSREAFKTQYGSCSFLPKKKGASIVVAQKNNDWTSQWFYYRVVSDKEVEVARRRNLPKAHPLVSMMNNFNVHMFLFAAAALSTRDMTEEYLTACVVPLAMGWRPESVKFYGELGKSLGYPMFGLQKEGCFPRLNDAKIVAKVEAEAVDILGPLTSKEFDAMQKMLKGKRRLNRIFDEMGVKYRSRTMPAPGGATARVEKQKKAGVAAKAPKRAKVSLRDLLLDDPICAEASSPVQEESAKAAETEVADTEVAGASVPRIAVAALTSAEKATGKALVDLRNRPRYPVTGLYVADMPSQSVDVDIDVESTGPLANPGHRARPTSSSSSGSSSGPSSATYSASIEDRVEGGSPNKRVQVMALCNELGIPNSARVFDGHMYELQLLT
ncbi:hypothetical protein BS78_04G312600 [Paspalum vaginatum]|nr:hypothetical protein BS78_04G312600 [Paspalum vaginatum]